MVGVSSGDGRVNEFIGLTTQHLVWMREHNRIEEQLHRHNPHWDGDKLYHEARRIISAMWQHTIYSEFLPILLGPKIMERYGLHLQKQGYWNGRPISIICGFSYIFNACTLYQCF